MRDLACSLLSAAALLAGCDFMATRDPGPPGWASVRISVGGMGSALGKVAGGNDTLMAMRFLNLQLSSTGLNTQYRTIALSGNVHTGNLVPAAQVIPLLGPRNWKLTAWTTDDIDSVIHLDSTTLYVEPGDTTSLGFTLKPRYSVLVGRFISQSNSITSIEKLELQVNGVVVDDTVFSAKQKQFNVVLSSKYLRVGTNATVKLSAMDKASNNHIKYTQTVTVNPSQGAESVVTVELD